ncbi:MAG: hypothetical protein WA820_18275 [Bradyrhizobium sp.]
MALASKPDLQGHDHGRAHDHVHAHGPGHAHDHAHAHGPASPHPAQPIPWSILRMTVMSRLAAAIAVGATLWVIVWLAMR